METSNTWSWKNAIAACIGYCVIPFVVAAEQQLSPPAKEFIAKGAQTALEQCDLPQRKCNDRPLKLKSADVGESNGEKKSFEKLIANGMDALVIFSASMRSKYSLSTVAVSNADWPGVSGVKVGVERETVVQALGEPNGGTRNSCDAYFDDASGAEAHVCYSAGKVVRIRWEYSGD